LAGFLAKSEVFVVTVYTPQKKAENAKKRGVGVAALDLGG
jgi:hypothetical protein